MSSKTSRIGVIGGGIAGVATAAELAAHFHVTVFEQEFQPGYHSTGRSAAVLHLAFENDLVHRLTQVAESFYRQPPEGFAQLAEPLDHVAFETYEKREFVEAFVDEWIDRCPWLKLLDDKELHKRAPLLSERFTAGILDVRSLRLDVDAILKGYRMLLATRGGELEGSRRVTSIERHPSTWRLTMSQGSVVDVDILVNAAGAWSDVIARAAGVMPIGLQPRRRTGVLVDPGMDCRAHPMCYRMSGGIYFKPEGSLLMVSPADETDSPPCDAQPEDLDVAIILDRLNWCTSLEIERPTSAWAGLRSFVPDAQPVIGFDPHDEQFFWVAALGGFGIQTAPAYSKMAVALLAGTSVDGLDLLSAEELSPCRL